MQRGNLDEFISDYDLGDVSSSASTTLYLTLKTAIILLLLFFIVHWYNLLSEENKDLLKG